MKLATLKDGSRDGQLVVVSRDLTQAHFATGIATTLQQALDDWNFIAPQLQDLSTTLDHGKARHAFPFDPLNAMAPLPRGGQCALQARGAAAPEQWPADAFAGAADAWRLPPAADHGLWLAPGWAALCGDIERDTPADAAVDGVRLLLGVAALLARRADAVPHPVALACTPVALTPDELGSDWDQGALRLAWALDGVPWIPADAAPALGPLLASLTRWRAVRAGTLGGWRLPAPATTDAGGPPDDARSAPLALDLRPPAASRLSLVAADGRSEPFGAIALRLLPSTAQA